MKRVHFHLFFHKIQDWICKCNLYFAAHTDCLTLCNQKLRNDWLIELGEGWSLSHLSRGRERVTSWTGPSYHTIQNQHSTLEEKKHSEETQKHKETTCKLHTGLESSTQSSKSDRDASAYCTTTILEQLIHLKLSIYCQQDMLNISIITSNKCANVQFVRQMLQAGEFT